MAASLRPRLPVRGAEGTSITRSLGRVTRRGLPACRARGPCLFPRVETLQLMHADLPQIGQIPKAVEDNSVAIEANSVDAPTGPADIGDGTAEAAAPSPDPDLAEPEHDADSVTVPEGADQRLDDTPDAAALASDPDGEPQNSSFVILPREQAWVRMLAYEVRGTALRCADPVPRVLEARSDPASRPCCRAGVPPGVRQGCDGGRAGHGDGLPAQWLRGAARCVRLRRPAAPPACGRRCGCSGRRGPADLVRGRRWTQPPLLSPSILPDSASGTMHVWPSATCTGACTCGHMQSVSVRGRGGFYVLQVLSRSTQ